MANWSSCPVSRVRPLPSGSCAISRAGTARSKSSIGRPAKSSRASRRPLHSEARAPTRRFQGLRGPDFDGLRETASFFCQARLSLVIGGDRSKKTALLIVPQTARDGAQLFRMVPIDTRFQELVSHPAGHLST